MADNGSYDDAAKLYEQEGYDVNELIERQKRIYEERARQLRLAEENRKKDFEEERAKQLAEAKANEEAMHKQLDSLFERILKKETNL